MIARVLLYHKKSNHMKKHYNLKMALPGLGVLLLSLAATSCGKNDRTNPADINKVGHVVVIYMENHSFDNLYGEFEGADGLSSATTTEATQGEKDGKRLN